MVIVVIVKLIEIQIIVIIAKEVQEKHFPMIILIIVLIKHQNLLQEKEQVNL